MATNADQGADDTDQDAEDILRSSKYPKDDVETSKEEDEASDGEETEEESEADSQDDGQTDDEADGDKDSEDDSEDSEESEEESEDDDLFVKKFPNLKGDTLPEYTKTLEAAYKNSTSEAMKWKKRAEDAEKKLGSEEKDSPQDNPEDNNDPLRMWAQQSLDKEITEAYDDFLKSYPQATEPENYDKFKNEVATLSQTIRTSQKRVAPPSELYAKAAVILGWKPTDTKPTEGERLKSALKDGAAIPKTSSGSKKRPKSKVTDDQIAVYRKMNPTDSKTDAEIREELENYA